MEDNRSIEDILNEIGTIIVPRVKISPSELKRARQLIIEARELVEQMGENPREMCEASERLFTFEWQYDFLVSTYKAGLK